MLRRHAILGLLGSGLSAGLAEWGARPASAAGLGVTLTLAPKSAPYPCAGGAYHDSTVLVFVPAAYRLPESKKVDVIVHFHGHNTTAKHAIATHKLREQLAESHQNAILVVPQGPVNVADGDFGKLMQKRGLANLLDDVLELAGKERSLEKSSLALADEVGRVVVSGHSGGYRPAAAAIRKGGVDLREVYLFDALYDEMDAFADFVQRPKPVESPSKRKLVSYSVAGRPLANSGKLARILAARGVKVVEESSDKRVTREELVKGRAVFLLGRGTHATATLEEHALRECLLASCFVGHDKSWLAEKTAARRN